MDLQVCHSMVQGIFGRILQGRELSGFQGCWLNTMTSKVSGRNIRMLFQAHLLQQNCSEKALGRPVDFLFD